VKDGRLPGRNVKNFAANEIKRTRVNISASDRPIFVTVTFEYHNAS
jgi:hypothetical protein